MHSCLKSWTCPKPNPIIFTHSNHQSEMKNQDIPSMNITISLSPITPLDTHLPSSPITPSSHSHKKIQLFLTLYKVCHYQYNLTHESQTIHHNNKPSISFTQIHLHPILILHTNTHNPQAHSKEPFLNPHNGQASTYAPIYIPTFHLSPRNNPFIEKYQKQ
jgi:hypothetical protein